MEPEPMIAVVVVVGEVVVVVMEVEGCKGYFRES